MKALVAGPAALLAIFEAFLVVSASMGAHPFWRVTEVMSLSEAVTIRDGPDIMRRLEAGADPNVRGPVRAGWLDSQFREVTPLEVAAFNRRPELVQLLLANSATLDAQSWAHLRCSAASQGYGDVVAVLDAVRPAGVVSLCRGGERFW